MHISALNYLSLMTYSTPFNTLFLVYIGLLLDLKKTESGRIIQTSVGHVFGNLLMLLIIVNSVTLSQQEIGH